jgi:hypothetical protein
MEVQNSPLTSPVIVVLSLSITPNGLDIGDIEGGRRFYYALSYLQDVFAFLRAKARFHRAAPISKRLCLPRVYVTPFPTFHEEVNLLEAGRAVGTLRLCMRSCNCRLRWTCGREPLCTTE